MSQDWWVWKAMNTPSDASLFPCRFLASFPAGRCRGELLIDLLSELRIRRDVRETIPALRDPMTGMHVVQVLLLFLRRYPVFLGFPFDVAHQCDQLGVLGCFVLVEPDRAQPADRPQAGQVFQLFVESTAEHVEQLADLVQGVVPGLPLAHTGFAAVGVDMGGGVGHLALQHSDACCPERHRREMRAARRSRFTQQSPDRGRDPVGRPLGRGLSRIIGPADDGWACGTAGHVGQLVRQDAASARGGRSVGPAGEVDVRALGERHRLHRTGQPVRLRIGVHPDRGKTATEFCRHAGGHRIG